MGFVKQDPIQSSQGVALNLPIDIHRYTYLDKLAYYILPFLVLLQYIRLRHTSLSVLSLGFLHASHPRRFLCMYQIHSMDPMYSQLKYIVNRFIV